MKSCNVVSLTKVTTELDGNNIELEKVMNAILANHQYLQFEEQVPEDELNKIYDFIHRLSTDVIYIHNNIAQDLTLDLSYNQDSNEFEITVNLIQTGQTLDEKLFDKTLEYYDLYESYIIENNLAGMVFVDFNTMTRNENLHIITKFTDGTVTYNGEER